MTNVTIGRVVATQVSAGMYRTASLTMYDGQVIEWRFEKEAPRRWSVASHIVGSAGGWGTERDDFYALRDAIAYVDRLLPSVENGNPNGVRVNHGSAIAKMVEMSRDSRTSEQTALMLGVAADLLEMHDRTSLSLDNWGNAGRMVNRALSMIGEPHFQPNGV